MTTIWQNEDGAYEEGCGCTFTRTGNYFFLVKRSPKCDRQHPTDNAQFSERSESEQ